jgi:hypothetical protein
MRVLSLLVAGVMVLWGIAPAPAQTGAVQTGQAAPNVSQVAGPNVCAGVMVRVRVSYVKPGQMPLFEKAVSAQQAFYDKAAGPGKHIILLGKVLDTNPITQNKTVSESQALTYHVYPVNNVSAPPADDDYKAFVKMFSESSTIKYEYLTCMAKPPVS